MCTHANTFAHIAAPGPWEKLFCAAQLTGGSRLDHKP